MNKLLLVTTLLTCAGCSGVRTTALHKSPTVPTDQAYVYAVSAERADQIIYTAMTDVLAMEAFKIALPEIGRRSRRDSAFDAHTWTTKAIPVTVGSVSGYVFEVAHSGSFSDGPSKTKKILLQITHLADSPVAVDRKALLAAMGRL